MEEDGQSPLVTATATSSSQPLRRHEEESESSGLKKGCLSFLVSLQEGFGYVKAFVVGQTKKVTARNEKEATRADLEIAKMQVEATDAAEDTKERLDTSS